MSSSNRELPHDLLAEKSLVGCLLLDGESFDEVAELSLTGDDFYHPQYGTIYTVLKETYDSSMPIDYVTVCSALSSRGKLEMVGGESAILTLKNDQATSANVYHYAKIVRDKSALRKLIKTSMGIVDRGLTYAGELDDFIADVESQFFSFTNDAKGGKLVKLSSCLKENLKHLEDTSRTAGDISGIPTGYQKLDKLLLGMSPGQLIILAARPAMGKSALAMNFALNCCEMTGLPVAVFSLEMLKSELSMRLLSMKSKVESQRLKTKQLMEQDLHNIGNAVTSLSNLPLFISDSGAITVPEIHSQCRKIKSEQKLGLIVIDYLQLLKSHSKNPSREQQIAEMSRSLKEMAKELEVPVIALSQLNRGLESRPDKRPMMSDLRESGSIEQDADCIMMIYRDEYYYKDSTKYPGIAEVIVAKNRGGETGKAYLAFVGSYTSFENLQFDPEEHQ